MADVLGILASVLQLVDLVATAGIYVKDLRNAPGEQQKIFAEVQALKPLLGDLHTRISIDRLGATGRTKLMPLQEPLAQLEKIMKNLADKVDPARGDRLIRRVNWTLWDKKQVKADLDEIERFKTLLNYWLGLNIWYGYLTQCVSIRYSHPICSKGYQPARRTRKDHPVVFSP
jgi:hypothetical protein